MENQFVWLQMYEEYVAVPHIVPLEFRNVRGRMWNTYCTHIGSLDQGNLYWENMVDFVDSLQ